MHWVYHPTQPARIVSPSEYPVYLREGWYDTPANFPQNKPAESTGEEVKPKKVRKVKKVDEVKEEQTPLEV